MVETTGGLRPSQSSLMSSATRYRLVWGPPSTVPCPLWRLWRLDRSVRSAGVRSLSGVPGQGR
eukprot:7316702-Alexandrium_andersonii.AAC.1